MAADSSDNVDDDAVTAITDTVKASARACFVLLRAPLQIYSECLKVVAKAVADVADNIRLGDDEAT
jgi:hypothetical protein